MGVESASDLLDFFDDDDFAVTAYFTPVGGARTEIKGIFEDPQASQRVGNMVDVTIPSPLFICRTVDIDADAEGDALVIGSTTYEIAAVMTDGTGVSRCMLEEQ